VLINGQRVGVIGLVNMNMLIADVTKLPDVKTGDEVVLIGSQGDLTISVASFSEFSNQLNYELLTRLPEGHSQARWSTKYSIMAFIELNKEKLKHNYNFLNDLFQT
jgi:alanine racemase